MSLVIRRKIHIGLIIRARFERLKPSEARLKMLYQLTLQK